MSGRNTLPKTFILSVSLAFLAAASYFPIAGRGLGLVAAAVGTVATSLAPSGDLLFGNNPECEDGKQRILSVVRATAFVSFLSFAVFTASRGTPLRTSLPQRNICELEGVMIQDSSFSSYGNYIVRLKATSCRSTYGYSATASGVVVAVGKGRILTSRGMKVRLTGFFSDGLFIFDGFRVLGRSWLNDAREGLICWLGARLFGDLNEGEAPGNPDLLGSMLLLGRSEDYGFPLKELAQKCGCSHVLALSGMHLGILAALCRMISKGRLSKVLSFVLVGVFLFVAGPRPSLLRAALMFCLWFIPSRRRLYMAFVLQLLIDPFSTTDLGCCYGYMAVVAIVFLQEATYSKIAVFAGKRTFSSFWLSAIVLVFCAPVQIATTGFWCPVAILISPIAGMLAAASMALGLMTIAFGRLQILLSANAVVYGAFEKLLSAASVLPTASWFGYCIMLVSLALLYAMAFGATRLAARTAHLQRYDVESLPRRIRELEQQVCRKEYP